MAMTEAQFIALEGNINKVWTAYFESKKDYLSDIYNVITGDMSQFTDYTIGAPGRMNKWNGSVQYDTIAEGFQKQYRAAKYDTGIQIDRDMWEDKEYQRIKNHVNNIAFGVFKTMIYESADILNNAFGTTYTGADGAGLCSATHHLIAGDAHQSNTGTLDLTYENLETTLRAMEDLVDDRGDKMLVMGNKIICSPYYRDTCRKLFGSDKEAFVADNQKNVYKDFTFLVHPLLTGKKWFVVNEELMKGGSGLNFFMRRDPHTIERDGDAAKGDFNTEKLSWKAVGRWDKGWTNWFWCFGQNAT